MNQAPNQKPQAKEYITQNWNDFRSKDIRTVNKELKDVCIMPTGDEYKLFHFWFNNKKNLERNQSKIKNQSDDLQSTNSATSSTHLAQQIYVQQVDNLLQNILNQEKNQRFLYLKQQIDENPFLLMNFMQNKQNAPTPDFLEIMIQICYELEENIQLQTQLFIRVCALHKNEQINTSEQLLMNALIELSANQTDQNAAYGVLKLAYQNDIPFVNFPKEALIIFQERYQLTFQSFFQSLSQVIDFQVINCLPETCFLFTQPFYKELKQGGSRLHQRITPQYLTFFIKLLAYSFESNQEQFDIFLDLFRQGCLQVYGRGLDISPLIHSIIEQEIFKNPKFFGSLENTIKLFQHFFEMIKEKIIIDIDQNTIDQLLQVNDMEYKQRSQQPKKIASNQEFENILKQYIQLFSTCNKSLKPLIANMTIEEDNLIKELKQKFNINQMNQNQLMSLYIMESLFQKSKIFQQFETGIGKTTLSLIFMIFVKQKFNINSLTIYQQEELCFRDFSRIQEICQDLNINIAFINSIELLNDIANADIVFIINSVFQQVQHNENIINKLKDYLFVIDEFDSILFGPEITIQYFSLYKISKYLIGFTGSKLERIHTQLLNKLFDSTIIQYPLAENIDGSENKCQEKIIFQTRNEQLAHILAVCSQQCLKTPIMLILDQEAQSKFFEQGKKILNVKDLTRITFLEIESFLKTSFLNKQNDKYFTCVINNKLGRGLDIPTNSLIEQNGGVSVIIASLPQGQREYDQFKGRTKRMCNKGQYFVLLWAKSQNGNQNYLEEQLDLYQREELLQLNQLLISINPSKKQVQIQQKIEAEQIKENLQAKHIEEEGKQVPNINEQENQQEQPLENSVNNQKDVLMEESNIVENNQDQTISNLTTYQNTRAFSSMSQFIEKNRIPLNVSQQIKAQHQQQLQKLSKFEKHDMQSEIRGSKRKSKQLKKQQKKVFKEIKLVSQ